MKCQVRRCRSGDVFVLFYGFPVCRGCWGRHCERSFLKKHFGIKEEVSVLSTGVVGDKRVLAVEVFDDWRKYFKGGVV